MAGAQRKCAKADTASWGPDEMGIMRVVLEVVVKTENAGLRIERDGKIKWDAWRESSESDGESMGR